MQVDPVGQNAQDRWDEKALCSGLSVRDPEAISEFLVRTHKPVYAMSARLTSDPDLRHDWTHEALLKILDELGTGRFSYRWPGCFWSWFQKRSYYLLINLYHGHRRRSGPCTAGEVGQEILDRIPLADGADPLRLVEGVEVRTAVEACLENLPSEDQRRAFHLALLEDLPYQMIAEEMGAELNTVRSWIRRARIAVRRCVAARYGWHLPEE